MTLSLASDLSLAPGLEEKISKLSHKSISSFVFFFSKRNKFYKKGKEISMEDITDDDIKELELQHDIVTSRGLSHKLEYTRAIDPNYGYFSYR